MNERIKSIYKKTLAGEMYVTAKPCEYMEADLQLSTMQMLGKRVCEYIDNQPILLLEESCFTGTLLFDESVPGDVFSRVGHKNFSKVKEKYYNNPVANLLTFEWQHSVGDFAYIIDNGLCGVLKDIEKSAQVHKDDKDALEFLQTQRDFVSAVIRRAQKASVLAYQKSQQTDNPEFKQNLLKLSSTLKRVPQYSASSFYEALLSLYFCYPYIRDSIGLIDRYLYPYYKKDIEKGVLTESLACEYLQELFLMLQAAIHINSNRFYRGGESHFCIGGYLPDGNDGFNELSRLIVRSLLDLPTWIPQISLRWTEKTPRDVFRFMLDCERKDPHKRIAFVNDEPRIKGLMKYTGITFSEAVNYTMMGCNELALPGGMVLGFDAFNIMRSVESLFYKRKEKLLNVTDFEEFYSLYEKELFSDLWEANEIGKVFQDERNKDINIVSNIFLKGCIENAKSCLNGGLTRFIALGLAIGLSNVIDSLSVVKQFVFEEKRISMATLIDALENDWKGYEDLHCQIKYKGNFFGNDDDTSNFVASKLFASLDKWNRTDNYLGKKWLFGNLIGYNEHHKFFGNNLKATPDGRNAGEAINFGIGQTKGKDREGLTALLSSVAKCDPYNILTGPSVTNLLIEENLIKEDENFEKMVDLFLAYFKMGGTHFQLTYISREDLQKARDNPDEYRNLRVRVSGFSDYFVLLNDALQEEIIERTEHKN